jgi:hypothetical protein
MNVELLPGNFLIVLSLDDLSHNNTGLIFSIGTDTINRNHPAGIDDPIVSEGYAARNPSEDFP